MNQGFPLHSHLPETVLSFGPSTSSQCNTAPDNCGGADAPYPTSTLCNKYKRPTTFRSSLPQGVPSAARRSPSHPRILYQPAAVVHLCSLDQLSHSTMEPELQSILVTCCHHSSLFPQVFSTFRCEHAFQNTSLFIAKLSLLRRRPGAFAYTSRHRYLSPHGPSVRSIGHLPAAHCSYQLLYHRGLGRSTGVHSSNSQ